MSVPESIKYRTEFIKSFQQNVSMLTDRGTPESMTSGRSVVFDVTAAGGRMQQRSIDGRIPRKNVVDTQVTATLQEYVDKYEITDFEAFTSQSDERAKMNWRLMTSISQEMDFTILNELANASTTYPGGAAAITLDLATKVIATLAEGQVPINPNDVTWVVSPKLEAKLQNIPAYTSADYVSVRSLESGGNQFTNEKKIKRWLNVGWINSPLLPNVGTSSCATYLFHRGSLGISKPNNAVNYFAGKNGEDHYQVASAAVYACAKILQQGGILKFLHNDTA